MQTTQFLQSLQCRPSTSKYFIADDGQSDHEEEFFDDISDVEDRIYRPNNDDDMSSDSSEPLANVRDRYQQNKHSIQKQDSPIKCDKKKLTRKRKLDPTNWNRNIQRSLRMEGKEYKTQHGRLKRA